MEDLSNAPSDLDSLRAEIEKVTLDMVRLLAQRTRLAKQIGDAKQDLGMAVDDDLREAQLRSKVIATCNNENDITLASRLLNFLLNESVMVQSRRAGSVPSHVAVFDEARRLEAAGHPMIHMEVGEPDSAPTDAVAQALAEACSKGYTKYGSSLGLDELRDAIAVRESEHGTDVSRDNVIVTLGARFAVYLAIESLLDAGDEIIVIEPAWPAYSECAMRAGIKVRHIRTTLESKWEPDIAQIESVITTNTKMIVMNYPNNPTGKVLPEKLVADIMDVAARNSIYVLSDEIYSLYSRTNFKSVLEFKYDRTIVTQSFSKSHAMTGFRMGYAVASVESISRMAKLQSLCVVCPPSPMQYAALAAVSSDPPDSARITLGRLDALTAKHSELEFVKPDGAMYLFARLPRDLDGAAIVSECLKAGLAIAPGAGFGNYPNFVRISACQDVPTLERGMDIINNVISQN